MADDFENIEGHTRIKFGIIRQIEENTKFPNSTQSTQKPLSKLAIEQSEYDLAFEKLQLDIGNIRLKLNPRATNAKIFSILQEHPCLVRCDYEICNGATRSSIDPWYLTKHEFAKNKIIDAIVDKVSNLAVIKSEHKVLNGKIDVVVLPDKVVIRHGKRVIAFEIKSGKSISLFQIERYLFESDIVVVIRVPTQDVAVINSQLIKRSLTKTAASLSRKIGFILRGEQIKIQGEWCEGCPIADCDFRKPSRWKYGNSQVAHINDVEQFLNDVDVIIDKTLEILQDFRLAEDS
jgi:hypothetical protein